MTQDLDQLRTDLLGAIDAAPALDALEAIRVHALGKRGRSPACSRRWAA
jgi:phenylalanyl-tRNA synthetase alpha chain